MKHTTRWTRMLRYLRNCRWSWRRWVDSWAERHIVVEDHPEADALIRQLNQGEPHR